MFRNALASQSLSAEDIEFIDKVVANAAKNAGQKSKLRVLLIDTSTSVKDGPGKGFIEGLIRCVPTNQSNFKAAMFNRHATPITLNSPITYEPFTDFECVVNFIRGCVDEFRRQHTADGKAIEVNVQIVTDGAFMRSGKLAAPAYMAGLMRTLSWEGVVVDFEHDVFTFAPHEETILQYFQVEKAVPHELECGNFLASLQLVMQENCIFRKMHLCVRIYPHPTGRGKKVECRKFATLDVYTTPLGDSINVAGFGLPRDHVPCGDFAAMNNMLRHFCAMCEQIIIAHTRGALMFNLNDTPFFVATATKKLDSIMEELQSRLQPNDPLILQAAASVKPLLDAGVRPCTSRLESIMTLGPMPVKLTDDVITKLVIDTDERGFGALCFSGMFAADKRYQCIQLLPSAGAEGSWTPPCLRICTSAEIKSMPDLVPLELNGASEEAQQAWRLLARKALYNNVRKVLPLPRENASAELAILFPVLCLYTGIGPFPYTSLCLSLKIVQNRNVFTAAYRDGGIFSEKDRIDFRIMMCTLWPQIGPYLSEAELCSLLLKLFEPGDRNRVKLGLPNIDPIVKLWRGTPNAALLATLHSRKAWSIENVFENVPPLNMRPFAPYRVVPVPGYGFLVKLAGMDPMLLAVQNEKTLACLVADPNMIISIMGSPGMGKSAASVAMNAVICSVRNQEPPQQLKPDDKGVWAPSVFEIQELARTDRLCDLNYPGTMIVVGTDRFKPSDRNRRVCVVRNAVEGVLKAPALAEVCKEGVRRRQNFDAPPTAQSGLDPMHADAFIDTFCAKHPAGKYTLETLVPPPDLPCNPVRMWIVELLENTAQFTAPLPLEIADAYMRETNPPQFWAKSHSKKLQPSHSAVPSVQSVFPMPAGVDVRLAPAQPLTKPVAANATKPSAPVATNSKYQCGMSSVCADATPATQSAAQATAVTQSIQPLTPSVAAAAQSIQPLTPSVASSLQSLSVEEWLKHIMYAHQVGRVAVKTLPDIVRKTPSSLVFDQAKRSNPSLHVSTSTVLVYLATVCRFNLCLDAASTIKHDAHPLGRLVGTYNRLISMLNCLTMTKNKISGYDLGDGELAALERFLSTPEWKTFIS